MAHPWLTNQQVGVKCNLQDNRELAKAGVLVLRIFVKFSAKSLRRTPVEICATILASYVATAQIRNMLNNSKLDYLLIAT